MLYLIVYPAQLCCVLSNVINIIWLAASSDYCWVNSSDLKVVQNHKCYVL